MILIKLVICCSVTLGLATVCVAKEWRGIVPLKSTRADVERLVPPKHVQRGDLALSLRKRPMFDANALT